MNMALDVARVQRSSVQPQSIAIWELLQWAFGVEHASVDLDQSAVGLADLPSVGIEYIMIERAKVGIRPDGGGRSMPHPDADNVADAIAMLPPELGGARMALKIADAARTGRLPDCMIGAVPRIVPRDWKRTKHGWRGCIEQVGTERWHSRGRDRAIAVYACPVRWVPSAVEIAQARRDYLQFITALRYVRDILRSSGVLTVFDLRLAMPPVRPWEKKC